MNGHPETRALLGPDPDRIDFVDLDYMLKHAPPEREYLFEDAYGRGFIPAGEGGGFAGTGGGGKSLLDLQKGIALAGDTDFIGYRRRSREPMHCYFYTAEDSPAEIHRRITDIVRSVSTDLSPGDITGLKLSLSKYLHVASLVGKRFNLTIEAPRDLGRAFTYGPAVDIILEHIETVGNGSGYVSIDPLRRVTAGKEDGEAFAAVIDACDRIREQASGTVTTCVLHHTPKLAGKEGDLTADIFRGAGDLTAGLRWTMGLAFVPPEKVGNLTLDGEPITPDQAIDLRRYASPKTNYERRRDEQYIKWQDGMFVAANVEDAVRVERLKRFEDAIGPLLKKIHELGRDKEIAERTLRPFAKKSGPIPIAEKDLPGLLDIAVNGGYLERKNASRNRTLYLVTGKHYETEAERLANDITAYQRASR